MTDIAQHCQARSTAQPEVAGYCTDPALWKVDIQLDTTTLAFSLPLCKTHLDELFDAVPGALSTGLPPATVIGTFGTGDLFMFPVTKCDNTIGAVPAHEHSDQETWLLGQLVDHVAFGTGIYRTSDGTLHLVRAVDGIRLQPLTPTPVQ